MSSRYFKQDKVDKINSICENGFRFNTVLYKKCRIKELIKNITYNNSTLQITINFEKDVSYDYPFHPYIVMMYFSKSTSGDITEKYIGAIRLDDTRYSNNTIYNLCKVTQYVNNNIIFKKYLELMGE